MIMSRNGLTGLVAIAFAFVALFAICAYGSEEELRQIQEALRQKGDPWVASMNPISEMPLDERRGVSGALTRSESELRRGRVPRFRPMDLPSHFDWRDNNGNWVTSVKYQGACSCCWDFAATASVESGTIIKHNRPGYDYDLSEQHILSCANAGDCDYGYPSDALSYYMSDGSPDEDCFPYEADDSIPCSQSCSDWRSRAQKIESWEWVTRDSANVEAIKAAVYQYPVTCRMELYDDFYYYMDGIYEYSWGSYNGTHIVLIIGWDEDEQYWIAKNSWGTWWGEDGFFRIRWGEVSFGTYSILIEPSDDTPWYGPELRDPTYSPKSGRTDTKFTFTVHYYHAGGQAPSRIQVFVNDAPHDMTLDSGTADNGTYSWTGLIPEGGLAQYHFEAEDSYGSSAICLRR